MSQDIDSGGDNAPNAVGAKTHPKTEEHRCDSAPETRCDNAPGDLNLTPQTKWKDAHPKEVWAHHAVRSGIRRGLLTPQPCEVCGKDKVDAHHDDYDRPLAVRWLCRKHHQQHHMNQKNEARQ